MSCHYFREFILVYLFLTGDLWGMGEGDDGENRYRLHPSPNSLCLAPINISKLFYPSIIKRGNGKVAICIHICRIMSICFFLPEAIFLGVPFQNPKKASFPLGVDLFQQEFSFALGQWLQGERNPAPAPG